MTTPQLHSILQTQLERQQSVMRECHFAYEMHLEGVEGYTDGYRKFIKAHDKVRQIRKQMQSIMRRG